MPGPATVRCPPESAVLLEQEPDAGGSEVDRRDKRPPGSRDALPGLASVRRHRDPPGSVRDGCPARTIDLEELRPPRGGAPDADKPLATVGGAQDPVRAD